MGKGSSRRPQLISDEEAQNNWDTIFCKKVNSDDVSPHTYEYELNKSTGNVEKVFKESIEQNDEIYKRLKDGTWHPNEEQFNDK